MPETMYIEAEGSLHLMLNNERRSFNFVNREGEPFTTMILVSDDESLNRQDISKYQNARISVTIEFDGEIYNKPIDF